MNEKSSKLLRYLVIFLLAAYLLLLIYLTFFSQYYGRGERYFRTANLIPFKTIQFYLNFNMDLGIVVTNLAGNIAAFVPLGFLLPFIFNKTRNFLKIFLAALSVTVIIETGQYLLIVGSADIDDVILNLLGAITGYFIHRIFIFILKALTPSVSQNRLK
ncbi:MAG: glycopeptide antibiotics resistance protein [Eubacterium sp.]|jgi:glycopeptide antibiotics resistance protein|nr:glycopeptide antibiotics resistance protein [Eubacterium sp.]